MPAPMMMASKSGIGVAPVLMVWCKAIRSHAGGQTLHGRVAGLQLCRQPVRVGFTRDRICPYRRGSDRPSSGDNVWGARQVTMNDPVDVLIIGAGASGAAVAWSLADTKMHILCLDQGGWMKPSEYPSAGRDWEAKIYGDWSTSPNVRGRPEDYPVNDDNSPIKVVNFNGVGGSTVMYTAHWPRLHPSDFKVKTLDGVADDWPIDYDALTPV